MPFVHSNYVMGGELLAQYALRMGHTRVGLLSGPENLESARQRRTASSMPRRAKSRSSGRSMLDLTVS